MFDVLIKILEGLLTLDPNIFLHINTKLSDRFGFDSQQYPKSFMSHGHEAYNVHNNQ